MDDLESPQWDGLNDRRKMQQPAIPLPIAQFVTQLVTTHTAKTEAMLASHIREEEGQLKELSGQIATLTNQLTMFLGRQELMEKEAFVTTPSGDPDFHGHKVDHATRKEVGEWRKRVRDELSKDALKYMLGGIAMFTLMASWEAFKASLK